MQFNTSFTFPSWDKSYVKLLHVIVSKGPCTWKEICADLPYACRDVLKGFLLAHVVVEVGKRGRAMVYDVTSKGRSIYAEALETKELCEMLEFAKGFTNLLEFKLNCTLLGHAEWCERNFIEQNVLPCFSENASGARRSMKHKLSWLPFWLEYKAIGL